jgi:hypothetical protein
MEVNEVAVDRECSANVSGKRNRLSSDPYFRISKSNHAENNHELNDEL